MIFAWVCYYNHATHFFVMEALNALELENSQECLGSISEKGNYYFFELNLSSKSIMIDLDRGRIRVGQEVYYTKLYCSLCLAGADLLGA